MFAMGERFAHAVSRFRSFGTGRPKRDTCSEKSKQNLIESRQNRLFFNAFRHISAMAESPSGVGTGGTAAAGVATTALQIVGDPAGGAGPAPPAKP